jgi:predicted amidohydrolase YtcJ
LDRVLPLRDLIQSGCRPGELLWFGSDTPIVRPHPQDSIQAAVQRGRAGMSSTEAIAPGQAVTESEAWSAFGSVT